jgi:outer membrane protein TolC
MKRTAFILILSVLAAPALLAAAGQSAEIPREKKTLTLEECVELGLKNSKALHASEMRLEAASAKSKEMDAARLPSLKLSGGYTRLSEVPPFEVTLPFPQALPFQLPTKFVVSPNYFNNYALRLSFQQPVFTGFRLQSSSDLAKWSAQASEQDLTKDKSDLVFAVRSAYWNLYKSIEFKKVIDENVEQVKAHLVDVKNFFDQGLLTRNEVLRVEVQLSNVRLAQIDIESALELAGVWLNNLIGLPLDTEIELATRIDEAAAAGGAQVPVQGGAEEWGTIEALLQKALGRRPELRAMEFRVRAGEAGVTLAKSSFYPQVFLSGNYYDQRPNPRLLPTKNKFYSTWDISLNISIDLWNWGATQRQSQQAKAQLAQAVDALGQMKDGVAVEVRQGWLSLAQAGQRIGASKEAVAQAEENLRVTRDRFKEGVALNTDVLDAEVSLLQAKTNLTQSLVDLELAKAKLRKVIGE